MNQMQFTSLEAYDKVKPRIGAAQATVLGVFYEYPCTDWTNMELADEIGWSINRVTPRVLELRRMGILTESKRRLCRVTDNRAIAWRIRQ